ncbi:MAG: hypothetical protein GY846_18860 [Deltaproteobacteria bacterium]|nr:hypothetical protein [Deltaproteobacteria bacterium]
MWKFREQLSYSGKLRRSIYENLRDDMERRLLKMALIDSYNRFKGDAVEYRFVEKSELKPKSKKMEKESKLFKSFLVIICENVIKDELKNYIRFYHENSVTKKNLEYLADFTLYNKFHKNLKYFDSPKSINFLEQLLDIDYALLIQQDPTVRKINRYSLTHFHVKIDWPISDAAETLAKRLRYIQNNLYEKGDKAARVLQNKLFEYYGCHHSVGGRRTAGLIAAQLLKHSDGICTVFVSSSESRILYRYSERGVSKFFLVQLTEEQLNPISETQGFDMEFLKRNYLYSDEKTYFAVLEAAYSHTVHSRPPKDGKLRKIRPAYNWLRLKDEYLHAKPASPHATPIPYSWVYATDK